MLLLLLLHHAQPSLLPLLQKTARNCAVCHTSTHNQWSADLAVMLCLRCCCCARTMKLTSSSCALTCAALSIHNTSTAPASLARLLRHAAAAAAAMKVELGDININVTVAAAPLLCQGPGWPHLVSLEAAVV
jgi:hypothetical protein